MPVVMHISKRSSRNTSRKYRFRAEQSYMLLVGRCAQIAMAAFDQIYYVGRQTAVEILAIRSAQCYSVREKYEPRFWRRPFGIFPLIFLAILGYCGVIASRQGAFCESSAYAKHCALIACRSFFSKFFIKNFEKKLRYSPKVLRNQKRQDVRLRRGEVRSACLVARARASTKYERTVSAFDRVRITPLHYSGWTPSWRRRRR